MGAMEKTLSIEQRLNQEFCGNQAGHRSPFKPLFRTIPPERVGLNGEYDHSGLAKRVKLKLTQLFGIDQVADLSVMQRGRVVIFAGKLAKPELLPQLVRTALDVHGTTEVETHGLKFR